MKLNDANFKSYVCFPSSIQRAWTCFNYTYTIAPVGQSNKCMISSVVNSWEKYKMEIEGLNCAFLLSKISVKKTVLGM